MTQLDMDAQASDEDGRSDASTEDSECAPITLPEVDDFAPGGRSTWDTGVDVDSDEFCQALQGLSPEEAEKKIRAALQDSTGEAGDADALGILLKVFRLARDSALQGYNSWDLSLAYCNRLTGLCDKNFVGSSGCETVREGDFPASIIAIVYAECGRTFALADHLHPARDRLQKAMSVFGIVPGVPNDSMIHQRIIAGASLGRVLRRLGADEAAQAQYLKALQLYADIDPFDDLAEFLSEYVEVLGTTGGDSLSPSMFSMIAEFAEAKLGVGSEGHMRVLREAADVCVGVDRLDVAAPLLAARARLLRAGGVATSSGARSGSAARRGKNSSAATEVEVAEEEAAAALEATMAKHLESGDLAAAARSWAEALVFRENTQPPNSDLLVEMRRSLSVLRAAAGEEPQDEAKTSQIQSNPDDEDEEGDCEEDKAKEPVADSWDSHAEEDDHNETTEATASEVPTKPRPSLLTAPTEQGAGLRPAWASGRQQPKQQVQRPPQQQQQQQTQQQQEVPDAWDS